jgi:excisionase family DNA binding protein
MQNRKPGYSTPESPHNDSPGPIELDGELLLEYYLSLPKNRRDQEFAETARAAEIAELSQRTIQLWIEMGSIQAIFIGGKYKILLESMKTYLKTHLERDGNLRISKRS